ncbi:hypothetical protein WA556_002060 [Blastocystis sp. ATCC 50177/Nand II]
MEANRVKQLKKELYAQNTQCNIPITLYVGIPRTPCTNGFSKSEVFALYSSSSIPCVDDAESLLELVHANYEFIPQPSDVLPILPAIHSSFMFDPSIERLSDDEMMMRIITHCTTESPTEGERQFMQSHHACLLHCVDDHIRNQSSVLSPQCVLGIMDHWKELAIAILSVLLQSSSTINTYCRLLVRMDLTESRLDVCLALMMTDLLPLGMMISSIITRILSTDCSGNVKEDEQDEL